MPDQTTINQPTINNADDSFLGAKARFDQWLKEFQEGWSKPVVETAAKMLWMSQPDQVKDHIRQSKPKAASKMDDLISGKEG